MGTPKQSQFWCKTGKVGMGERSSKNALGERKTSSPHSADGEGSEVLVRGEGIEWDVE